MTKGAKFFGIACSRECFEAFPAISCEILLELGTCVKCPIPTPAIEENEENWDFRFAT
jgi:hypothetical protein